MYLSFSQIQIKINWIAWNSRYGVYSWIRSTYNFQKILCSSLLPNWHSSLCCCLDIKYMLSLDIRINRIYNLISICTFKSISQLWMRATRTICLWYNHIDYWAISMISNILLENIFNVSGDGGQKPYLELSLQWNFLCYLDRLRPTNNIRWNNIW